MARLGGDGLTFLNLRGDFLVQGEELGGQILLGVEAVGGEDGGVQRREAVLQRIRAGHLRPFGKWRKAYGTAESPRGPNVRAHVSQRGPKAGEGCIAIQTINTY